MKWFARYVLAAILAISPYVDMANAQSFGAQPNINIALNLIPLNNFGFSASNTAAQNTTIFNNVVGNGNTHLSINCGTYLINTLNIGYGYSLVGQNKQGCVTLVPTTNTTAFSLVGAGIWMQNIDIAYANPEPVGNTGAVCLSVGNNSDFLYESTLTDVTCENSNTFLQNGGTNGEFQNNFNGMRVRTFSSHGINESVTSSGSTWNNLRMQVENSTTIPTTSDTVTYIKLTNAEAYTFNGTNLEFGNPSTSVIALAQSTVTFNGLHFEWLYQGDFTDLINMGFQSEAIIHDFSIQNSIFNGSSSSIFKYFANATSGGANTVVVDGFLEYSNTFTTKLSWFTDDGNFNHSYVRGINGRNSGNVVVSSRNNFGQFEQWLFDSPGGKVISGCSGTTSPSGGMPLPWSTTASVALQWQVGDYCNNSAPTNVNAPGWRSTAAGSPGTFLALPPLILANITPTIGSGFGTAPSIVNSSLFGTFTLNVGTGGTAATGIINLSQTAPHGWDCKVTDLTTKSAAVSTTQQTASTATSCTVGNYTDLAVSGPWAASDVLSVSATPY